MAFFGLKKEGAGKKEKRDALSPSGNSGNRARNLSSGLARPRITEKAMGQRDRGVYTFIVRRDATKYDVRDAIREVFTVTPRKITIVNVATRMTRSRGRKVAQPGMRKANVFLKKGARIDLA